MTTRRSVVVLAAVALASGAATRAAHAQLSTESPGPTVDAQKLTKAPKQTKFVEAEYPKEALEKGVMTDVVLLLDINAEGKVDSVGLVEPANPPGMGFEEAAMVAAQQFEFEPAEMDGQKIAVQISYKYKFRFKVKAAPVAPPDGGVPDGGAPIAAAPAKPAPKPVMNFAGVLKERGTRLPLAGVLVTVFRDDGPSPIGFEATTDATGAFQFFDLTPGEWKLLAEPPGFFPYRTAETIKIRERIDATYYVERGEYNPYDVIVTAAKPRKEVSRTVITAQELDKVPGTFGDPLAVVQNFAGVARPPPLSGLLIVRGSAPEDTRIFVDGAEIPLIYHFGGLRTVLPVGMIDAIQFYPGNFSTAYGRALGGVVDVQLKRLQPKKVGGYADVNLFDSGLYLEVPFGGKGGIAVAGRRSYVDFVLDAATPSNAPINLITAPRYYDYQLLANYRPAPAHDFRAFFFGSDDRLVALFSNPGDLTAQISSNSLSFSTTFYRGLATYNYVPSPRFENSLRVGLGNTRQAATLGQLRLDYDTTVAQLRDTARFKQSERLTLVTGIDAVYSRTDIFARLPLPEREGEPPSDGPPDLSMLRTTDRKGVGLLSPAAFLELELQPLKGLLIIPGARIDYFQSVHQTVFQPRLTVRWAATPRLAAKGGVGLFAQEPVVEETDAAFGNPTLKSERALHVALGGEYKPRPWITLELTGFYKNLDNLVSATDATVIENGITRPLTYDNNGTGRVFGLEAIARHDFTNNFSGWLAYTLSRSTRRDSGAAEDRLFDYDQTHILTVVGSYLLPRNWQIGGRFRLVSGNPITPVRGAVYNASTDRYDPYYGTINSDRLPMFHQLDLRIDKRWIYQRWMLSLYLDIQNVYNRSNVEGYGFNYNFRRRNPEQGLPILTILGIKAEF
jgi:TonB family protein